MSYHNDGAADKNQRSKGTKKVNIPDGTDLNKSGQPKVHGQILDCINENYSIFRNEITMDWELNGKAINEQEYNSLFIDVMEKLPNIKSITKATFDIVMQSDYIPTYNPIADFFKTNNGPSVSDINGKIKELADSLIITDNHYSERKNEPKPKDLVLLFLTKWLVGLVASVYDTNYNVLMLVLIGSKGCGKTEFWRRLLPESLRPYFTQCKFDRDKDDEALMCEMLIILNDELDGLHAKEARTFRNFISANSYTYRPPYGKRNIKRKRLASVCGASNDHGVILDPENNRRIVPIEIIRVDHDIYNSIDKTHLLMEAHKLFRQGYDYNLTPDEIDQLDIFSKGFELATVETELIQQYCKKGANMMTATEIMGQLQEKTSHKKLKLNNVGKALRFLEFKPEKKRLNNSVKQVYAVELIFPNYNPNAPS